jgi:hypothetical protein
LPISQDPKVFQDIDNGRKKGGEPDQSGEQRKQIIYV